MPFIYFNAYNPNDAPSEEYQRTGSTCTWRDNDDTTDFSNFTGDNEFWPSPDAGAENWSENQNFIICWCDDSVANTTTKDGDPTSKVSYWGVDYSSEEEGYLDWLNEALRCSGGTPQGTLANALSEAASAQRGIWTNYQTDIAAGVIT